MPGPVPPVTVPDGLLDDAAALLERTVDLRRRIHAYPELGLHLPRTQAAIVEDLADLDLPVTTGADTTSVVAVLEGAQPGPTTLLRGDMDALPMPEDTGLPYASTNPGTMHACGHDAHVAMLAGAARLLAARRGELRGRVVFMFQPGEEGFAGAEAMIDEGLLRDHGPIDRAFAIHVTPVIPSGVITCRPGTFLAAADEFEIRVTGRGGHASMPHDAIDPIPVACEIVLAAQTLVTRTIHVFDPVVLSVTKITGGTTNNVIPESVVCEGTVRAVSEEARKRAKDGLGRVAAAIAGAHGCSAQVRWIEPSYPVTVNDGDAAARTLAVADELLGAGRSVTMPYPVMGAEDWSFVLQKVPGSMAFLGVAPPGVERPAPNHSNRMIIDENAMVTGMAMHAAMALC